MRMFLLLPLLFLPVAAFARMYSADVLPYTDVTDESRGAVAISTLTKTGVLQGNPDGTYRPFAFLNRAEFTKIAVALIEEDRMAFSLGCFPDVPSGSWYEIPVCKARAFGIVSGNAEPGVPQDEWKFAPARQVNFAEAVKMLVEIYGLPVRDGRPGEAWYVRYFEASMPVLGADSYFDLYNEDITSGVNAGWYVTRWEMARLAVAFLAYDDGELEAYRAAEDGASSSVPLSSSSVSSQSSAVPVSSASSAEPPPSAVYDSDSDVSQYTNFLPLGDPHTQVLAAVNVFSNSEPLTLNTITVSLSTAVQSVGALHVYDQDARYLGRAFRDDNSYTLNLKTSDIVVPQREDYSLYVRAEMRPYDQGGVSGEAFTVSSVTVEGDGFWSNNSYTKGSSDTFPSFQTTRSVITIMENPDALEEPLTGGDDLIIGTYRFAGETGDGAADLAVTDIDFTLSVIGDVTVAGPQVGIQGFSGRHDCSIASSTITCTSLPEYIGSFEDGPVTLVLYADVTVSGTAKKAALGANINQPGSVNSAGDITWTDGTSSFTWVPGSSPVIRGTYFTR